jgi:DNA-binding NarL/FixJ family response regulator
VAEEEVQAVREALAALEQIEDRLERADALGKMLAEWPDHHAKLREARQEIVLEMHSEGQTYREIGEQLGMHYTRAQQIAKGQRGEKNRPKKKAEPAPPAE